MALRMDLTGQKYGRLTVLARAPENGKGGKVRYVCKCNCGSAPITVFAGLLRSGATQSCGCLHRERTSAARLKHGHTVENAKGSVEYQAWLGIKKRCYNPKAHGYKYYGGATPPITVADEWLGEDGFNRFLEYVGPRPEDKNSLGRIDNSRGYEPGNVRWENDLEQGANRRGVIMIDGLSMRAFAKKHGLDYDRFKYSYRVRGRSVEQAIIEGKLC